MSTSVSSMNFMKQDENMNTFFPISKPVPTAFQHYEKRVFGRNIGNIQVAQPIKEKCDQAMEITEKIPSVNIIEHENLSNGSNCDVGEEAQAMKPFGTLIVAKEICEKMPINPCTEYEEDIDNYLLGIEQPIFPKFEQTELTEKMRSILVDWLADVHLRFKLNTETLFLTVNIIDKYLSKNTVPRQKLQLLGVTAMLIACKYEEIYAPEVKDFAYITDDSYTKEEILQMEQNVLKMLDFNVTIPSSFRFLQRFLNYLGTDNKKVEYMAQYLIELSLIDCRLRKYKPSVISAGALYIANRMMNKDKCWNPKMAKRTKLTDFDLKPVVKDLMILMQLAEKSSLKATKAKFATPKYGEISKLSFKRKILA